MVGGLFERSALVDPDSIFLSILAPPSQALLIKQRMGKPIDLDSWHTLIRLSCIEEDTGLLYRIFRTEIRVRLEYKQRTIRQMELS